MKKRTLLKEAAIEGLKAGVRTATVYITVMSIVGLAEKAMLKSKKRKEKQDNFIKELEEHDRELTEIVEQAKRENDFKQWKEDFKKANEQEVEAN